MEVIPTAGGIAGIISIILVAWRWGFQWSTLVSEVKKLRLEVDKLITRVEDVSKLAENSSMKIEPFWEIVKRQLPTMLTISRSKNLLEKLAANTITNEELTYLEGEVERRLTNNVGKSNTLALAFSLWAIKVRKNERGIVNGAQHSM